jgi:hypothetical protein
VFGTLLAGGGDRVSKNNLGSKEELSSRIDELPDQFKVKVRSGYKVSSLLSQDARVDIFQRVIDSVGESANLDSTEISKEFGILDAQARDLTLAISISVALLLDNSASESEFVELAENTLVESADLESAKVLYREISIHKVELQDRIANSTLASSVLPIIRSVDIEIDLRLKFEHDVIVRAVPVAILHLDTDSSEEIWLQLKQSDVRKLIETLTTVEEQLKVAASKYSIAG